MSITAIHGYSNSNKFLLSIDISHFFYLLKITDVCIKLCHSSIKNVTSDFTKFFLQSIQLDQNFSSLYNSFKKRYKWYLSKVWQSFRLWEPSFFEKSEKSASSIWNQIIENAWLMMNGDSDLKAEFYRQTGFLRKQIMSLVYFLNNQSSRVSSLINCEESCERK